MSSTASAGSCYCHWVFTEAPPPPPPLLPTSVPHLSALSKGLGEADKPLMRACLIWPGRLCSTSFLPATILLLLRSCQRFRGPRHLSALLPPSSRVRLLPSHWWWPPKVKPLPSSRCHLSHGLQWIWGAFFSAQGGAISGHWSFIPHC